MKKILLTAGLVVATSLSVNAQVSQNAIGLRFGDSDGLGAEVSYQRSLTSNNRLEANLGWRGGNNINFLKVTGIYQWYWPIENNFVWYAGVGGAVGTWSYSYNHPLTGKLSDSGTSVAAAGQIGIEYHFNIPLQVSLDFKPEFNLMKSDHYNSFGRDIALSVRYKF